MFMEEWKEIKGFENYLVSNLGNIKSKDWIVKTPNGLPCIRKGKLLKPYLNKKGYLTCDLRNNNIRKIKKVHRLVAESFIANPENLSQINHKDGNKQNNNVNNLEWCNNSQNQLHAFKNNLQKGNFNHPNSKLTLEQVLYIKNNCKVGSKKFGIQTIAKKFNVCNSTIKQIITGKSYRNITNKNNN